jgi:hypothetical protein
MVIISASVLPSWFPVVLYLNFETVRHGISHQYSQPRSLKENPCKDVNI